MEASWFMPLRKGTTIAYRRGKTTPLRQEIIQEVVSRKQVGLCHYVKVRQSLIEAGRTPPRDRKLFKRWCFRSKLVSGEKE